jgi:allantoinase
MLHSMHEPDAPLTQPDKVVVGRIVTHDGSVVAGYVRIAGERIYDVTATTGPYHGPGRVIDVGDAIILPGAVDAHVHSYSHGGEGLRASTAAAAAGGVTTIVEMPFDGTEPINTRERLAAKASLIGDEAIVDVALLATLEPCGGWRRASELAENGAVGFKVSLFDTDRIRFPRISDAELLSVMRAAGEVGSTLCVHAENNEIVKALLADEGHRSSTDPRVHAVTHPPVAESLGALTAMEIAAHEGNALHVCHLSLGRSAELVDWYREQGTDVTFETCPHYLVFTDEDVQSYGGQLKINPPIRPREEQEAMWSAVAAGRVPVISSDHAPWPIDLKNRQRMLDNASGVPGVQTLVAATLGACLRRYGTGKEFAATLAALTSGPARRYGLGDRKGALRSGYDADLMILQIDPDYRITVEEQRSNAGWTPYEGFAPGVQVTMTFSRGTLVWEASSGALGRPGRGIQLKRPPR